MNHDPILFHAVMAPDNLRLAFLKAARGKRHRPDVISFSKNFETNIRQLYDQLFTMTLDIGHYRFFQVWDPKSRSICAASFPERVLHHALMNVCEPLLDRYAIFDSYACRKGKGLHRAVTRAKTFARKFPWYLKLDIRKYFDSIHHGVLMMLLKKRIHDPHILEIFRLIFKTYHTRPGTGLPIGNLVSQHMANFYLGGFDHWVKEVLRVPGYIRYMDDFVLFGPDKSYLKEKLEQIRTFLDQRLHLVIRDNIQLNRCNFGIPFLGFRVFPADIRLSPGSKKRFIRKFKAYEKNWEKAVWSTTELSAHMVPLVEFTRLANAMGFRANVIERFGVTP